MVSRGYNRRAMGNGTGFAVEDFDVEVRGARLRARLVRAPGASSKGPTVVLLHEGLGSVDGWRGFPERLVAATGLPMLLYDRRGYGLSDPRVEPWGVDYLHRAALGELPAVLRACGIERPVLLGHSDGGTIALLYASRHDPAAIITEAAHVFVEEAAREGIRRTVRWWNSGDLGPRLERLHGAKTEAVFQSWADTWLAPWFDRWSIVGELHHVRCPALLIQGADDEYATPRHLAEIAARLAGPVRCELVAGCGHAPHHDRPGLVTDLIAGWLASALAPPA